MNARTYNLANRHVAYTTESMEAIDEDEITSGWMAAVTAFAMALH